MHLKFDFGPTWQPWLKNLFTISGYLFIVALIVLISIELTPQTVGVMPEPEPLIDPELVKNAATYTAGITSVLTPLVALYAEILSARKAKVALEIEKTKLELERMKKTSTATKKPPTRKNKSKRGKPKK